jgi:hypothetical protein
MQKSWHRLQLDVHPALTPEFAQLAISAPCTNLNFTTIDWFPPSAVFDPQWLADAAEQWNLNFYRVLLFVRENDQDPGAHVDHGHYSASINWCLGPDHRHMLWYQLNPGAPKLSPWFRYDQVQEIDRCHVGSQPVLIRTDIPHSISGGSDRRVCISARLDPPRQSWDQAVALCRPLIISE